MKLCIFALVCIVGFSGFLRIECIAGSKWLLGGQELAGLHNSVLVACTL